MLASRVCCVTQWKCASESICFCQSDQFSEMPLNWLIYVSIRSPAASATLGLK